MTRSAPFAALLLSLCASQVSSQSPSELFSVAGQLASSFGQCVDRAGDVDGDGIADLVVGGDFLEFQGVRTGGAMVISGATGNVLHSVFGASQGAWAGYSVAGAGDVDGDGYDDFAVGAPRDGRVAVESGLVTVHSGRTGAALWSFTGSERGEFLGRFVAGQGDVNADGYGDVFVSSQATNGMGLVLGRILILSGPDGSILHDIRGVAPQYLDTHGDITPDLDGDGFDDFLFGFRRVGGRGVRVVSGRTGATVFEVFGDSNFGLGLPGGGPPMTCVDDVDGDLVADVAVGERPGQLTHPDGAVFVYSGATGTLLHTIPGQAPATAFGTVVANAGDVDGDGVGDLALGDYLATDSGTASGAVLVVDGATGTTMFRLSGSAAQQWFGYSVGLAGDLDQDGFSDVVVGAPREIVAAAGPVEVGAVHVFTGGYTGSPATARRVAPGCAGSNGALPTGIVIGRPFLGSGFGLRLRGALPNAAVVLNLGAGTRFDLTPFGMPGCVLAATGDGFVVGGSQADALGVFDAGVLQVPLDVSLLGVTVVAQWICTDAAANAVGVVFSSADELVVGR